MTPTQQIKGESSTAIDLFADPFQLSLYYLAGKQLSLIYIVVRSQYVVAMVDVGQNTSTIASTCRVAHFCGPYVSIRYVQIIAAGGHL